MTALQPTWPTPLVETDPRLTQYYRFAFSNQYAAAGTQTVNYGNARGGGIVALNRFEFDFLPPAYIQHNSTAVDGFGDCSVFIKARIASANAEHGNYILTASGIHTFATGSAKNGALTDSWTPQLAGGIGLTKHIDVESSLSGNMPTGKSPRRGALSSGTRWCMIMFRSMCGSNSKTTPPSIFRKPRRQDAELYNAGAFYVVKNKEWKSTHPYLVFVAACRLRPRVFTPTTTTPSPRCGFCSRPASPFADNYPP